MGKYDVRLGAKITLDSAEEGDLIAIAEKLNNTRKMSGFMGQLFRIACDHPEVLSRGSEETYKQIKALVDGAGVSEERQKYFKEIEAKVQEMKDKIDKIYDLAMKAYMLSQVNKMNGLEGKSQNVIMAQFALQKQMKDIESILGCSVGTYESGKMTDVKAKSDEILEFIVETYDGIGEALGITGGGDNDRRVAELEQELTREKEHSRIINDELKTKDEMIESMTESMKKQLEEAKGGNADSEFAGKARQLEAELEETRRKLRIANIRNDELEDEKELLERKVKRLQRKDDDGITEEEFNKMQADGDKTEEAEDGDHDVDFGGADFSAIGSFFGS